MTARTYYLVVYEDVPYQGATYTVKLYEEVACITLATNKAAMLLRRGFNVAIERHVEVK